MIEFDPSEYQKCAVTRQTYELTELCLGRDAAELFLYKPPDEVSDNDRTHPMAVGE